MRGFYIAWIFAALFAASLSVPARAHHVTSDDISPPCKIALGDIWGDNALPEISKRVDGKTLTSPVEIAKLSAKQSAGVIFIKGGEYAGWDFRKVSLRNICFLDTDLSGSNWEGGSHSGIGFIRTDISGANMKSAAMPGIMFRNADISNVDAAGANWSDGSFDGGWFDSKWEGLIIDNANMRGFVLQCGISVPDGCPVVFGRDKPISAKGADFTDAHYPITGDWDQAVFNNSLIGLGAIPALSNAKIEGDIFIGEGELSTRLTPTEIAMLIHDHDRHETTIDMPSFDCTKARSRVENEICGEYESELRRKDRQLASLYKTARNKGHNVVTTQKNWLRQRNVCGDQGVDYPRDCLMRSYDMRIGELLGQIGETGFLARGEKAIFAGDTLPLSDEMRGTELFQRLIPVFEKAAYDQVLIGRATDGSYSITGEAIGANAHMCNVGADGLSLDKDSGWYVLPQDDNKEFTPVFRIVGDTVEIFANGRPDYKEYSRSADHMGCGVRASFGEMRRLDVEDVRIENYLTATQDR